MFAWWGFEAVLGRRPMSHAFSFAKASENLRFEQMRSPAKWSVLLFDLRKKTRSSGVLESWEWQGEKIPIPQRPWHYPIAVEQRCLVHQFGSFSDTASLNRIESFISPLRRLQNPRTPCFFLRIIATIQAATRRGGLLFFGITIEWCRRRTRGTLKTLSFFS